MQQQEDSGDGVLRPPTKKLKLSLGPSRFDKPKSVEEMQEISKGYIPANTAKSTAWGVKVFQVWRSERNQRVEEQCPSDLFERPDPVQINFWLSRFVAEVRKQNGAPYPPRSIQLILSALQREMLDKNPEVPKFMDQSVTVYRGLHRTCDSVYRELHKQGIGATVRHTAVFSVEEENKLWEAGVLAITSPKALQRAVFFYVGKFFCIRGGDEQRKLGPSQFKRLENPDCYVYTEHGSKNRSGGLAQLKVDNKSVPCYSVPDKVPKCLVFLLDFYLAKLPPYATKEDVLYCRPKSKVPADETSPWYEAVAIGKNSLGAFVKDICKDGGLPPRSNHSLRATGATTMFQANVPEKIIQTTTGHRSIDGLRRYERISTEQHQALSRVMMSSETTTYQEKLDDKESKVVTSETPGGDVRRIFGDLTNVSIGSITINVNRSSNTDL